MLKRHKHLALRRTVYSQDAPPREWLNGGSFNSGSDYYMRTNDKFYRFVSERAFKSWSLEPVMLIHGPEDFGQPIAGVLGFRDGTLLNRYKDNTIHVVSGNKTRHITNEDALETYGLLGKPFYTVSEKEFNVHDVGDVIDE